MSSTYVWISALVIMNFLWAGSYTVMKLAAGSLHPLAIVFWRMLIAMVITSSICILRGYSWRIRTGDLIRMISVGFLSATGHFLVVAGVNYSNATDASLLYTIEPVCGIVLATWLLKEKISGWMILSFLLIAAGVAMLTLNGGTGWGRWSDSSISLGNVIIIAGLLCEGCFSVVVKPLVSRYPAPITLTFILFGCVLLLFVPTAFIAPRLMPTTGGEWWQVFYLAIFCSVIGYLGWLIIMRHVAVNVMYFSIFLQPISGPFIAWAFIGEQITTMMLVAGLFLISGLFITVWSHISKRSREIAHRGTLVVDPA